MYNHDLWWKKSQHDLDAKLARIRRQNRSMTFCLASAIVIVTNLDFYSWWGIYVATVISAGILAAFSLLYMFFD